MIYPFCIQLRLPRFFILTEFKSDEGSEKKMIKTFCSDNVEKLDLLVNDWMAKIGKNCPVRTDFAFSPTNPFSVLHRAVIFYDYDFRNNKIVSKAIAEEPVISGDPYIEPIEPEKKPYGDRGGLWMRNGKLSGKFKDQPVSLTAEETQKVISEGKIFMRFCDVDCVVLTNRFKSKPTQPSHVILPRSKGEEIAY